MIGFTCAQIADVISTAWGLSLGFREANRLIVGHVLWAKPLATLIVLLILRARPRYSLGATLLASLAPLWNVVSIARWLLQ